MILFELFLYGVELHSIIAAVFLSSL